MLDYKVDRLSNGLKIVTAPIANTKAVTVLFLVSTGSRYEEASQNGIAHFLEHMFFKGTKKRPNTLDIAKSLDSVGAIYNAFTSEEDTGFFVRSAGEHFELSFDILSDILFNSLFSKEEIERERCVILEEINMYQDNPQSYIAEVAKQLFYGNQPLGRQVTGVKETVKSLTREDFMRFRDKFYQPKNMMVVVAGSKNNVSWQGKIKEFFDKISSGEIESPKKVKEDQKSPQVLIHQKKTDQAHLILGFRTIPRTDKRRPILNVLNNLFGENMSSRLFTEVRERRGLAYYVSSETADFLDAGVFGAIAGVDISRAKEAIKVILREFNKIKEKGVTPEELKKAKENLKGRLYLGLEESHSVAEFLAEQELFWGKIKQPEELVKEYEEVTASDIQKFAQEFFVSKNLNLALLGPFKKEEEFLKILEGF